MIISRTPYRISFFGGGTDYPAWYRQHGGAVLATSIDKYCYLSCRYLPPFFEHRLRVVYSKIETCKSVEEIAHPVVRATLQYLGLDRGMELHHDGDLPARSGMGSSSSFAVGLLNALYTLRGEARTKLQLAQEAIAIEQDRLRETVGSQDQVMAAFGGFNYVQFHHDDSLTVDPLPLPDGRLADLQAHLMLFYTGVARTSSDVAQSYAHDLGKRRKSLEALRGLVEEGIDLLVGGGSLRAFGELLHEGWTIKRGLSPAISTSAVDALYAQAREAGAIGGKLTGAGGGGFLLLFVPPERRGDVAASLDRYIHVPFAFESAGSRVILSAPEVDYGEADRVRSRQSVLAFREHPRAV